MYFFSYENVPSQECQTAYEHECSTVYATSYETVYKDKCSTKYESECKPSYGYYGGQDCQQVPKQSCIKVKVLHMTNIPIKMCFELISGSRASSQTRPYSGL